MPIHQHVCRPIWLALLPPPLYLLLLLLQWELIAGPDLLELLNEAHGRMNEPAAAFYFVQLLRGVLHMHAMGYCHRDIKPENCMVERASQRLKVGGAALSSYWPCMFTAD